VCVFSKEADLCNAAAAASHQALQSHPQLSAPGKTANSITLSNTESDRKNNNEMDTNHTIYVGAGHQQQKAAQDTDAEKPRGPTTARGSHGSGVQHLTSHHLLVMRGVVIVELTF